MTMDTDWILPLAIGAVLWAGCDVISDGVIGETHTPVVGGAKDAEEGLIDGADMPLLEIAADVNDYKKHDDDIVVVAAYDPDAKLTGEQDSIVSGIVMLFCGFMLHLFYGSAAVYDFYTVPDAAAANFDIIRIAPGIVFYAALISGVFQCFSLIYLLKSFESSSSTVIVPLMQLNSLFVLPIGIVLSFLSTFFPILSTFHKIITPLHFIAFILIFIGGFYPAVEGEWSQFNRSFWRQRAVRLVLLSDLLIAVYYVLVTFCTNESGGMSSMSFLVISIYGNAITFLFLILFVAKFRRSAVAILYIRKKYVLLSALGEVLSITGYFFVSISYHRYYNGGVVSATEGALNQMFNLIAAILLKRFLNFGRDVKRIKEKVYSCVLVTIGLALTST
eukprot:gene8699-10219_t